MKRAERVPPFAESRSSAALLPGHHGTKRASCDRSLSPSRSTCPKTSASTTTPTPCPGSDPERTLQRASVRYCERKGVLELSENPRVCQEPGLLFVPCCNAACPEASPPWDPTWESLTQSLKKEHWA